MMASLCKIKRSPYIYQSNWADDENFANSWVIAGVRVLLCWSKENIKKDHKPVALRKEAY